MKILGTSDTGGTIIEFTQEETGTFALLEAVCKGRTWQNVFLLRNERPSEGHDVSSVFAAIHGWVQSKFAVNQLQEAVNRCNEALGMK